MRRFLLYCGVVSSGLYAAITALVALRWESYSSTSQTISELSAIGAPTRQLWVLLSIPYTALVLCFGWGIWKSASSSRALRIVGGAILASGVLDIIWPFAPMHLRETLAAGGGTFSDTMHIALGAVTVLLMLVAMAAGATALGRRFRVYSVASIVVLAVFGVLTFLDAPALSANRPTPWIGVWERINVGVFMLWNAILALSLLQTKETKGVRVVEIGYASVPDFNHSDPVERRWPDRRSAPTE